jgi:hypothetical protein
MRIGKKRERDQQTLSLSQLLSRRAGQSAEPKFDNTVLSPRLE